MHQANCALCRQLLLTLRLGEVILGRTLLTSCSSSWWRLSHNFLETPTAHPFNSSAILFTTAFFFVSVRCRLHHPLKQEQEQATDVHIWKRIYHYLDTSINMNPKEQLFSKEVFFFKSLPNLKLRKLSGWEYSGRRAKTRPRRSDLVVLQMGEQERRDFLWVRSGQRSAELPPHGLSSRHSTPRETHPAASGTRPPPDGRHCRWRAAQNTARALVLLGFFFVFFLVSDPQMQIYKKTASVVRRGKKNNFQRCYFNITVASQTTRLCSFLLWCFFLAPPPLPSLLHRHSHTNPQ